MWEKKSANAAEPSPCKSQAVGHLPRRPANDDEARYVFVEGNASASSRRTRSYTPDMSAHLTFRARLIFRNLGTIGLRNIFGHDLLPFGRPFINFITLLSRFCAMGWVAFHLFAMWGDLRLRRTNTVGASCRPDGGVWIWTGNRLGVRGLRRGHGSWG